MFVDETGFRLLPARRKTYAPRGQRPTIQVKLTRDHLSVIGGITLEGHLLVRIQKHSCKGADVVAFLRHLLREIPGTVLVIWDGGSIHHNRLVARFVSEEADGRVVLEPFPPYAPELNPCEALWNHLKNIEMRNLACADLDALWVQLRLALARVRQKRTVILGCIAHSQLV